MRGWSGRRFAGVGHALHALALLVCGTALAADEPRGDAAATPSSVQRLVAMMEVSPDTCAPADPSGDGYRTLLADIDAFRRLVPEAAEVPIDIGDCYWDGIVVRGERVVLSVYLARATPAQRFFILAHELGHVARRHHASMTVLARRLLELHGSEAAASLAIRGDAAGALSRANEAEADAFAVRLMLRAGLDPEEAARFWEQVEQQAHVATSASHPSARSRATAIRRVAGTVPAMSAGSTSIETAAAPSR